MNLIEFAFIYHFMRVIYLIKVYIYIMLQDLFNLFYTNLIFDLFYWLHDNTQYILWVMYSHKWHLVFLFYYF